MRIVNEVVVLVSCGQPRHRLSAASIRPIRRPFTSTLRHCCMLKLQTIYKSVLTYPQAASRPDFYSLLLSLEFWQSFWLKLAVETCGWGLVSCSLICLGPLGRLDYRRHLRLTYQCFFDITASPSVRLVRPTPYSSPLCLKTHVRHTCSSLRGDGFPSEALGKIRSGRHFDRYVPATHPPTCSATACRWESQQERGPKRRLKIILWLD